MTPLRTSYWHIESVWLFYLLAAIATAIFTFGLIIHISIWMKGIRRQSIPFSWRGIANLMWDGLLGRRIFKGDIAAGTMHLLIMWGFSGLFLGTVLISVDYWVSKFLRGSIYIVYSACLEIAGLMLTIGLIWALIRRYFQRVARLERRLDDLAVLVLLGLVAISGFLVEGLRLAAQNPDWGRWSFAGYGVSLLWSDSQRALSWYPFCWWTHALLSLGLIAYIPYSKLFHILAAPVSIYLEAQPPQAIPVETRVPGQETFSYRDMIFFDACTRCGRCVEECPSTGAGEAFSPRDFIAWERNNLLREYHPFSRFEWFKRWKLRSGSQTVDFDSHRVWHCTTCRACLEVCPVYAGIPDAIRDARSKVVEEGTEVPPLLTQTLKTLYKYNNPWEATKKKRANWARDMEIPDFSKGEAHEGLCYFVGCTTSMDIRAQGIARSFAQILQHLNVDFAILGNKEPCCGDIARRAGEDGLFEKQMEDCREIFSQYHVHDLVTSSPHCFHTFINDYPAYQAVLYPDEQSDIRVRHYTMLLAELVKTGTLNFTHPLKVTATYHDPCYLGRHNGVFNQPREVIDAIPGVQRVEMAHTRNNSLCCGGGGDRVWQEDLDAEVKMAEIRIREAEATGAEILITACPLCLIMFEDIRKTAGLEQTIQVMDLNEFVVKALGLDTSSGNE
ncbi:MAG: heterodisulfide reductase-related iron-sulfur binding cluster [Thermodesulfobacteriota bacterium]